MLLGTKWNLDVAGHYARPDAFQLTVNKTPLPILSIREGAPDFHDTEGNDEKVAFGGRAALLPLILAILRAKKKASNKIKFQDNCSQECKTVKSVFIRSASLLSNSKKIELK